MVATVGVALLQVVVNPATTLPRASSAVSVSAVVSPTWSVDESAVTLSVRIADEAFGDVGEGAPPLSPPPHDARVVAHTIDGAARAARAS